MARRIFVTATDTDAGKTYITAMLLRGLRAAGRDVIGLKPVASGVDGRKINADVAALLAAQDLPMSHAAHINLYSFEAPLAPSQAAAAQGRHINEKALVTWCEDASAAREICLIEGVGGLMAPLTDIWLVSDWLAAMPDCEVLLVVRARLGGINHALLTLDKLQRMGRMPHRIIINDADAVGDAMLERHATAIMACFNGLDITCCSHGGKLPAGMP